MKKTIIKTAAAGVLLSIFLCGCFPLNLLLYAYKPYKITFDEPELTREQIFNAAVRTITRTGAKIELLNEKQGIISAAGSGVSISANIEPNSTLLILNTSISGGYEMLKTKFDKYNNILVNMYKEEIARLKNEIHSQK